MLFSVIVPCYNNAGFLRNCLNSILAQDSSDFEIVAIDDGSTDGTSQILDEYAAKYDCVHVYHFANSGVAIARKRGLNLELGDYVIFVDSDDTINPNLLSELKVTLSTHNYPDIVRYQANLVNDAPHKDHQRYNFTQNLNVNSGIDALKLWSIEGKKYAVYWLFAFKASIFSKVPVFPKFRCYEDVALIPLLIAASSRVVTIDYVGYNYTCNNSNSLTNLDTFEDIAKRANYFYKAYSFAVDHMGKLDGISISNSSFFVTDYTRRLRGMYDSLPEELKSQFEDWF